MKSKIAVFDLDDTIGNFRSSACKKMNEKYDKTHTFDDWEHHLIEQLYNIDKRQFMKDLVSMKVLENMAAHHEAKEVMQKLNSDGYHIAVLTARQWHPNGKEITLKWLNDFEIPYNDLLLCEIDDRKSDIVSDVYGRVSFVVDDSPHQIEAYWANTDIDTVYIYDMPWNREKWFELLGCKRIKTLEEIVP